MAAKRLKTAQVNLRIDPELKAAGQSAAEAERLSLTVLVERLLEAHCRASGFWPPDTDQVGRKAKGKSK